MRRKDKITFENYCTRKLDHHEGNFGHWTHSGGMLCFGTCSKLHRLTVTGLKSALKREVEVIKNPIKLKPKPKRPSRKAFSLAVDAVNDHVCFVSEYFYFQPTNEAIQKAVRRLAEEIEGAK